MNHRRYLCITVALGLLVALSSATLRAGSAASMARGPESEANTIPQTLPGGIAATPLDTAFTYQGRLDKGGTPVDGTCDLQFGLWDAASGGNQVGPLLTRTNVPIRAGLFTVADLGFGGGAFSGEARWLQVAVQCSGETSFTTLSPRQALTATPYASYAAQVGAHGHLGQTWTGSGTPLTIGGSFSGPGAAPLVLSNSSANGLAVTSAGSNGLAVGTVGGAGVFVNSATSGLWVNSAGWHGVEVMSADNEGVRVDSAGRRGVYVVSAATDGLGVDAAGVDGVHVVSAGNDGVYVERAGNPSAVTPSDGKNGFEVAGAEGAGLFVGRADLWGVYVASAGKNAYGLVVVKAGGGAYVGEVGHNGVSVGSAGRDGVSVYSAENDGMSVYSAGHDGVHVQKAAVSGVAVIDAGRDGVYVGSAGYNGLYVGSASADGVYANTTQGNGQWGFNTPDKIHAGSGMASGGPVMIVAQNGDSGDLERGDVVSVSGMGAAFAESESPTPRVRRAGPGSGAIVGAVYSRFVAEEKVEEQAGADGQVERRTSVRSHSVEGPIAPGDYLLLVVLGPAQVKASALAEGIRAGDLLAAAGQGQAATLLAGTYIPGSVLGTAMEALGVAQSSGLIWVLVQPR